MKTIIVNTLAIVILFTMSLVNQLNSDCCKIENVIHHACIGIDNEINLFGHKLWGITDKTEFWIQNDKDVYGQKCISRFCNDFYYMEVLDFYCGHGKCNIFGCNCDNGCRKHNASDFQSFEIAFAIKYGFVRKSRHKLF